MKHWKKVIGLLLALLLAVMAIPLGVLAAEDEEGGQIVTLDPGDKSLFSGEKAALMGTVPEDVIVKDGITRGEWMQNLVLLFDMSITKEEYPDIYFPDISADTEYFDAIMTAVKYGVVDIEAGDDFLPEAALSRDFAAHTLNFCLGMEQAAEDYTYEDAADTAHPDDAQTALEQGWFELADGCFLPEREVTAEEITAMLNSVQSILDGQEIGEAVSEFKFAEYVKLVPEDADITTDFDLASDEVWVTVSGWDCPLAPGDTFAFYAENFAFVYGVAEAECADGVWTILTEDAPDDAVLDFSFAGELNPELTPELPEV